LASQQFANQITVRQAVHINYFMPDGDQRGLKASLMQRCIPAAKLNSIDNQGLHAFEVHRLKLTGKISGRQFLRQFWPAVLDKGKILS
jgi:hypothetical protein